MSIAKVEPTAFETWELPSSVGDEAESQADLVVSMKRRYGTPRESELLFGSTEQTEMPLCI